MYFDSFESLIEMGGHGKYVWSAYGLALIVLVLNLLEPIRNRKKVLEQQRIYHLQQQRRRSSESRSQ